MKADTMILVWVSLPATLHKLGIANDFTNFTRETLATVYSTQTKYLDKHFLVGNRTYIIGCDLSRRVTFSIQCSLKILL